MSLMTKSQKAEANRKWYEKIKKDPERYEALLEKQRANRLGNPKRLESKRRYRQAAAKKIAAYNRKYDKDNAGAVNAYKAKDRVQRKLRLPKWADLEAIKFFYECCPKGCHVDHIIPLQGANISGLHVVENLQWLPAVTNIRKANCWGP